MMLMKLPISILTIQFSDEGPERKKFGKPEGVILLAFYAIYIIQVLI